jgi:predicted metal-dependent hydrolase
VAVRYLVVPQIGEVAITKRRGNKNIRLSINAAGQVRVGLPAWTPYEAGVVFVKKNKRWIKQQLLVHGQTTLSDGDLIGKHHHLVFINHPAKNGLAEVQVSSDKITLKTELDPANPTVQKQLLQACEKTLKQEAQMLLPTRMLFISQKHDLPYRNLKIRKMTTRWGSCSSQKNITLSYFLIQLPWKLIDYVILHELAHTLYPNHSRDFWQFMAERVPNLRDVKIQIKSYRPRIQPL